MLKNTANHTAQNLLNVTSKCHSKPTAVVADHPFQPEPIAAAIKPTFIK